MKILWIPHTGWEVPQRAHPFCRALAERHDVHVTDWGTDFSLAPENLPHYLGNFRYKRTREGRITIHRIPRLSPALYFGFVRKLNIERFSRYVDQIVDQYAIEVVVGSFLSHPPQGPRLIYDVVDDNPAYWREFRHNETMAREIEQIEAAWYAASDHITTVSSVLQEKVRANPANHGVPMTLIPNGVRLDRYRQANGQRIRTLLGLDNRKVVGLISSLGEFSGVERLIEAAQFVTRPDVTFLIVGGGPLLPRAKALVERYGLSNVIFTGPVSPDEVADYYAALDAGVIPFDLADFTHSACPLKLLEYTACNKPVVSTPLEEVKRMALPHVTIAGPDPESFAVGISQALETPVTEPADLRHYDWGYLADQFEQLLSGAGA